MQNNKHPFFCEEKEEPKATMTLDAIMGELVRSIVDKFLVDLKEDILALKKTEIQSEQEAITSSEYMTRKDVMKLLKRCDSTLTKWARKGYLVPLFIGGKYLYRKSDVMKLMK